MTTEFIGEHLIPGKIGYLFVILSFVASLFSCVSYFLSVKTETIKPTDSDQWRLLGRGGFIVHTAAIVGIFSVLFYIIINHLFEYHYAWEHSSRDLPGKFLLSCFWEGQEGSFMLWTFWHCVLGLIVMVTAKKLETRTMAIIAMVQVFLGTMILGIYLGNDIKIGSTPFLLLRHAMQGAPIFSQANYMSFIKDGNGLNVSLQNYWMTIHPPVLFLGFASTLIPFAFCIAALWKNDYELFIKPTLAWTLFGGAVLGTGIIMGGAWAYESLNFGGYWAWDPVENASLVPWLVLIAGLHTLLVYRSTGRAFTATIIFLLLAHLLVWYSTFLTRTGILGKTSVHAFTGDGQALYYHLLVVMGILLALALGWVILRWKKLPTIKSEEELMSREFWMFIGSAILFICSLHITFVTSIPVWAPLAKWISGKDIAPPTDPMKSYNDVQVWIAIIIGILAGGGLFLKYKTGNAKGLLKRMGIALGISVAMALGIGYGQHITTPQYSAMLFTSCFALVASVQYGIQIQKIKFKNLGPSVAHAGFAMVLLGILLSSYGKHAISFNSLGITFDLGKGNKAANEKESAENQIMYIGTKVAMGDYIATYVGDSDVAGKDRRIYYKVKFEKTDSTAKKVKEQFMLYPDAFVNPKGQQGLSANPSTQHYLTYDVYTFINQATDKSKADTSSYVAHDVHIPGDTTFLNNGYMIFKGLEKDIKDPRYVPQDGDIALSGRFQVYDAYGPVREINPIFIVRKDRSVTAIEDTIKSMDLYARLDDIKIKSADSVTTTVRVRQTDPKDDYIVLKALVFPYINVLWLGVIVMVFGFLISLGKLVRRMK